MIRTAPGGFNPYKIGIELFRDIERRWNTGQHGPAFERLDKLGEQDAFDAKAVAGRAKIFEVRRLYNDVSAIGVFHARVCRAAQDVLDPARRAHRRGAHRVARL